MVHSWYFFHVYPHMTKLHEWNMSKLYVVTVWQGLNIFKEVLYIIGFGANCFHNDCCVTWIIWCSEYMCFSFYILFTRYTFHVLLHVFSAKTLLWNSYIIIHILCYIDFIYSFKLFSVFIIFSEISSVVYNILKMIYMYTFI